MHVESGPVWSRLIGADGATLTALDEHFKVTIPGAWRFPAVKEGRWDGCVRYFKIVSGLFMTGFLPELMIALAERGQHPKIVRTYAVPRPAAFEPLKIKEEFAPREYQIDIVDEMLVLKRGVIKAATNSGKTEIVMMFEQRVGLAMLYLVTEQTLWDQTYERFRCRFGSKFVGRVGAGTWDPKLITIAMVQTVAPMLTARVGRESVFERHMPHKIDVLIADEVHLFTGDKKRRKRKPAQTEEIAGVVFELPKLPEKKKPRSQWVTTLEKIPAPYRFGMSGTPLTEIETRDRNLVGLTGPMFAEITNRELVDMGFSAIPRITFVKYPGFVKKLSWSEAYRELVVENEQRNAAIAELCRIHAEERVLILANWEQHARIIKRVLGDEDLRAVMLSGRDPLWSRKRWLKAFKSGSVNILVVTTIFDQGIDIPEIDVLIMAGGGGVSPVKPLQRLGRGLRKRPDKDEVVVYDFMDPWQKDIERHSKRRMRLFKDERFVVQLLTLAEIKARYEA